MSDSIEPEIPSKESVTSACDTCPGRCCSRAFGFESIKLTSAEALMPVFRPYAELWLNGSYYLPMGTGVRGKCRFLNNANRCSIYEQRPEACRGFVCHDHYNRFLADGEPNAWLVTSMRKQAHLMRMLRAGGYIPSGVRKPLSQRRKPTYPDVQSRALALLEIEHRPDDHRGFRVAEYKRVYTNQLTSALRKEAGKLRKGYNAEGFCHIFGAGDNGAYSTLKLAATHPRFGRIWAITTYTKNGKD